MLVVEVVQGRLSQQCQDVHSRLKPVLSRSNQWPSMKTGVKICPLDQWTGKELQATFQFPVLH